MDEKDTGTNASKAPEQTESMKSLHAFINEISRQMVHQMAIMNDGEIHITGTIKNRIISGMDFRTQSNIDF